MKCLHKEKHMIWLVKCVALLALVSPCQGLLAKSGQSQKVSANPIRRVVNMLQSMQKKVQAEGKKEAALFESFMCYCKNGRGSLEESIETAKGASEQLASSIEETSAALAQAKGDLAAAQASRAEAKETLAKASSLRRKEAAEFAKSASEMKTNIAGMTKATHAVEKGLGGAFLQTSAATVVKELAISMDISATDRETLTSFLSQRHGNDEGAPGTGEIIGILKQMTETMQKEYASADSDEKSAARDFNELEAAKKKEVNVLAKQIETKTARIGELGVQLITQKEDHDDTSKSLQEDTVFLKDLESNCKTKASEWDEIQKVRAEELVALSETIKILNDDSALDLFKKSIPTPSLLQLTTTSRQVKARALMLIQESHHIHHDFRLNLISLAMKGKNAGFEKVIRMVDNMSALLKKEQEDDDNKKEYCKLLIDKTEDEIRASELSVSDVKKAIANGKESIAALAEEISTLSEGIHTLDKQVVEATTQRKEEHADSVEVLTSDNAAKELIGLAKKRLNKFYNPSMAFLQAPRKHNIWEEDLKELSFAQLALKRRSTGRAAPPPPPETAKAYKKKGESSNSVIAMLDTMVADLEKEILTTTLDEKEAQKEYEQFMGDSSAKRANDAKSIADKEAAKTDLEATLLKNKEDKKKTAMEAMMQHKLLGEVHGDCDFLLQNYANRKEARSGEADALSKAKAVLSGAD